MTSPENQQPITPENKQAEAVSRLEMEKSDGFSHYIMDANEDSPSLNARIDTSLEKARSAVVTESAWGLSRGTLFADEKLDVAMFVGDGPAAIERRLRKDMKNGSADAILIQTAEGYVYRSNPNGENSSTAIAVLNEQKGNRLLGKSENYENSVGRYIPRKDDLIVITDKQRAEEIVALPASEAEARMFDAEGEDAQSSFITIETPLRLSKNMFEAAVQSRNANVASRVKQSQERPARRQKAAQAVEAAAAVASPERDAPWANNEAEEMTPESTEQSDDTPFVIGQEVIVERSNGDHEDGWKIAEFKTVGGAEYARVVTKDADGKDIEKHVAINKLKRWQSEQQPENAKQNVAPWESNPAEDPTEALTDEKMTIEQRRAARLQAISNDLARYEDLAIKPMADRRKGKLSGARGDDDETITVPAAGAQAGEEGDSTEQISYNELVRRMESLAFRRDMTRRNELRDQNYSDDEISEIIASEQRDRAIAREDQIHDAMTTGKFGSMMEKYANYSRKKKIAVGLAVTAGIAMGGILIGGATAGAGAVVGLGAAKSAKAYLKRQSKVYERKADTDIAGIANDESSAQFERNISENTSIEDRNRLRASRRIALGNKFEHDAHAQEIKRSDRNKRIAVGLGAAAGALVGTGVVLRTLDTIEWAKNIDRPSLLFPNYTGGEQIDRPDIDAPTGLTPEQDNELNFPGDDTSVDDHHLDRDQEWPGGENHTETEAEKAAKSQLDYDKGDASGQTIDERAGSAPEYTYDPSAAETIEAGEGWNQTFGELGITDPSDKAALLADSDLMHQLQDRGLAYYDEQIGGWGMNMTADGQLPESAIDAIQDRAAELTSQEAVESADITEAFSDAANEISNGEGWNQTFGELGITDPNQQYALLNNYSMMQELKNLGLAYQDADGWKMNMTPTGKMPHEALDIVNKYAQAAGYDLAA